jgi:hypothetical protein
MVTVVIKQDSLSLEAVPATHHFRLLQEEPVHCSY